MAYERSRALLVGKMVLEVPDEDGCYMVRNIAIVYGQTTSDLRHEWSDSFDSFRANIRVLDEPTKQACETR